MSAVNMEEARSSRLFAARAAAHIDLLSRQTGIAVDGVPWQVLSALPDWCLTTKKGRQELLRVCGALYLSPSIRVSIDGLILRKLRHFVGSNVFHHIRSAEKLNHDVAVSLAADEIEIQVMSSGTSVLLGTLHDNNLISLYRESIFGLHTHGVSAELAHDIYSQAASLVNEKSSKNDVEGTSIVDEILDC